MLKSKDRMVANGADGADGTSSKFSDFLLKRPIMVPPLMPTGRAQGELAIEGPRAHISLLVHNSMPVKTGQSNVRKVQEFN